jgi:hypothetical protein
VDVATTSRRAGRREWLLLIRRLAPKMTKTDRCSATDARVEPHDVHLKNRQMRRCTAGGWGCASEAVRENISLSYRHLRQMHAPRATRASEPVLTRLPPSDARSPTPGHLSAHLTICRSRKPRGDECSTARTDGQLAGCLLPDARDPVHQGWRGGSPVRRSVSVVRPWV